MKKIIILLALNITVLFSQNIIDPPTLLLDIQYTDTSLYHTQFDGFVRGWNGFWISEKLGTALNANIMETKGGFPDNCKY